MDQHPDLFNRERTVMKYLESCPKDEVTFFAKEKTFDGAQHFPSIDFFWGSGWSGWNPKT